jgi:PAS domain S-box-containing protein
MTARPLFRYTGWTLVGLLVGTTLLSMTYYASIASMWGPIDFFDVFRWQLSAWIIWLVLGPLTFVTVKPIIGLGPRDWRMWLIVGILIVVTLAVHAAWYGFISISTSPYPTMSVFWGAVDFHARLGMPADLAAITMIVFIAARAVAAEALTKHRIASAIALRESEEKFRSFFEDAVFDIFRSTPSGHFLMLNKSAARAMGYDTPEEAMRSITNIGAQIYVDPGVREAYVETLRREGQVTNWIWKMRRRDGTVRWNNETSRAVFNGFGELEYIEGTAKDITAEMEAREALQQSERHQAELRAQLADAQLRALKLQMKPHFLFNVLNTVAMMIRTGETEKAQQVVTMLGSMFRRFLEFEGADTVTLEQEFAFVELYLGLERFRFEDRVEIRRDIESATLPLPVPTLILQPLIENAVKHGLSGISGLCQLYLGAHLRDGVLEIEIANDVNPDAVQRPEHGYGIGVRNTRARLWEIYGDKAAFDLISEATRVRAVLRIPTERSA